MLCDGVFVYKGVEVLVNAEPVVAAKPKQPKVEEPKSEQYRLKTLINVRKKPSMDADIVTIKPAGALVRVLGIEDGWLLLIDGNYIFF